MAENNLPALLEANKESILARFPKLNDWLTPEIWWSVVERLRTDPRLQKAAQVNPNSVITALLDLASWGLVPDGKEAFINSYEITQKDGSKLMTAQAQWIWQGGVRRAVESGVINHAVAEVIREGEEIETWNDDKGRHLKHIRRLGNKRPLIGAYCLYWLRNGLMDYELCDEDDVNRAKEASKRMNYGKLSPAWQYGEPEQWKKTALRRGLKRMVGKRDQSFAAMMATEPDYETDTIPAPTGELLPDEQPRAVVMVPDEQRRTIVDPKIVEERCTHDFDSTLTCRYCGLHAGQTMQRDSQHEAHVSSPTMNGSETAASTSSDDDAEASNEQKAAAQAAYNNCKMPAKDKNPRLRSACPEFKGWQKMTVRTFKAVTAELENINAEMEVQ